MYRRKAELFHRPIVQMTPACAAACSSPNPEAVPSKLIVGETQSLNGISYMLCKFGFCERMTIDELKKWTGVRTSDRHIVYPCSHKTQ